mmetsp:Transcript_14706/g.35936  ORF Transcript_14706/g.35936 Transcript_14706/m.35936 type:complete len:455 (+) Transcript_14706:192-1556(+)
MSESNNGKSTAGAAAAFGMTGGSGTGSSSHHDEDEQQPTMRSVAIMSAAPAAPVFSSSLDVQKFARAGSVGSNILGGIKQPPRLTSKTRSVSVTSRREWNESNWKVSQKLDQVPVDFPLERTHREVHGATAVEVANRISNTLRMLSVDADYDSENAKAKCKTSDSVSFRIRLFAGGEEGLPVIVEVQRRQGPTTCFMRVCRQILDGAEGKKVEADTTTPVRKQMPACFGKGGPSSIGNMKCLQGVPLMAKRDPHAEAHGAVLKSFDLLRSKEKDANVLGLENLCHCTDPLKTRPDIALISCKALISGEHSLEIREEVGVMLQKDTFDYGAEEAMIELCEKCRHLALVLLSNVLLLTSKEGSLCDAVKSEKWFSEFLIPSLLDEIRSHEHSSNNAYEAACGITCLAKSSDVARRLMEEHSAVEDLQAAHRYALVNHELLANEAERSLAALGHSTN